MMETEIEKNKKKRSSVRSLTTKLITKIESVIKDEKMDLGEKFEELSDLYDQLLEKSSSLKELDNKIESLIKDTEMEAEVMASEEYSEKITKWKSRISRFLKEHSKAPVSVLSVNSEMSDRNISSFQSNVASESKVVKLPKLSISKYYGDSSLWLEFWSQYESAIHKNDSLSDTQKFIYLKSLLGGIALNTLKGFALTSENYNKGIQLLRERFGRDDFVINCHVNKLLNLEPVKYSSNIKALRNLYDELEINIRSLESLNVVSGTYGHLLCPILLKLIPEDIALEYNRKRDSKMQFDVSELVQFIKTEVECREASKMLHENKNSFSGNPKNETNKKNFSRNPTAAFPTSTSCIFCKGNHGSFYCDAMSAAEKRNKLKAENRCFKCFRNSHISSSCKSKINPCKKCDSKYHHDTICFRDKRESKRENLITVSPEIQTNENSTLISSVSHTEGNNKSKAVLLQTCEVYIHSNYATHRVNLLYDTASMKSFITRNVARKLKMPIIRKEHLVVYTFGNREPKEKIYDVIKVKLSNISDPSKYLYVELFVTDSITNAFIPLPNKSLQNLVHTNKINVTDLSLSQGQNTVDILIGADIYWQLHMGNIKKLNKDLFCIETLFGWTITGVSHVNKSSDFIVENLCLCEVETENDSCVDVNNELRKMWEIESLGIVDNYQNTTSVERDTLQKFEENIKFKNERYEVKLPFTEKIDISDNFALSKRRLFGLLSRFQNDSNLYENYANVIQDQLRDGIIETVDASSEIPNHIYYMPHHPIIRNDKETTKLRIVFDASAKEKNCLSLNDNLLAGPNLNPNIFTLLLKFRKNKIGIISDIEKAFLQVSLAEEDRDCQRFLFVDKLPPNEIKYFRNKTVTFGVKSSPFLLSGTIKHHIKKYENEFPLAYKVLNEHLYVDDLITSTNTVEEAVVLSKDTKSILRYASMNLRKWKTNCKELSHIWLETKFETQVVEERIPIKVLGIIWNTLNDELKLDVQPLIDSLEKAKNSKRSVLQVSCKLFDPIGITSAFIIRVKILLQEIWEQGLNWDENLPENLKIKWRKWCSEVPQLVNLTIPRCYFQNNISKASEPQLHIFCDASELAYGVISYVRVENEDGNYDVSFVTSKARVAPLKKLSLPRLELMATLIGARLLNSLREVFDVKNNYVLWTDSSVALSWIRGKAKQWKPFVSNRVNEIQDLSDPQNWKHCRGVDNPADVISRGCSVEDLLKNRQLWKGPQWLILPEHQWPRKERIFDDNLVKEERRSKEITINCVADENIPKTPILCLDKYSSIIRVYRITAWIMRFLHNFKVKKKDRITSTLTAEELERAEEFWLKTIQAENFPSEIKNLKEGKMIPRNSKIRDLNPFLCDKGLLVVGGRLQKANMTFNERHPIIIPANCKFAELVVRKAHETVLHSGVADTLVQIRERFWLPKGRQLVKSILRRCVICKRFNSKPGTQVVAPLPKDRIEQSSPFDISGLDFAGPVYVKNSDSKFYILLCTCAVTRAIHLELVTNLTTEVFLLAFRRFIARRGLCSVIYSDNAKTFKRAELELKEIWTIVNHQDVKSFCATQGIKWKYIVERGAWWGGFYERMIRSMKTILRKAVGKTSLTIEELETVLTEIEAVINSRPLTYVHSDVLELSPLTPAHLLLGRRMMSLPAIKLSSGDCVSSRKVLIKKFNYRERLLNFFWDKWRKDYLLNLRSANCTKFANASEFKVNDVVLVSDEHLPRNLWKLGKITETFAGRDGKIRSCTIKTEHSTIKRPVQLLYNLELQD